MELIGREHTSGRSLYALDALRSDDIPRLLSVPSPYYVCLLAWDSRQASVAEIGTVVEFLIRSGCVYVCCWGPDCERVHDLFDEFEVEMRSPAESDDMCLMSTWHTRDPLSEAIWFSLFLAQPHNAFANGCRSLVGVSVGSPEWAAEIRAAFADPAKLSKQLGYGNDCRL